MERLSSNERTTLLEAIQPTSWARLTPYLRGCFFVLGFGLIHGAIAQAVQFPNPFYARQDSLNAQLQLVMEEGDAQSAAHLFWQLGNQYFDSGVYTEALSQYNQALDQLIDYPSDTLRALINNGIGEIYLSVEQFESAEKTFEESLNFAKGIGYLRGQAKALGGIGACQEKLGEYLQALSFEESSLLLFEQLADREGIASVNENIGSIHEDLQNYQLAFDYFTKAYQYWQGKQVAATANILNNLGDVYRKQGFYAEAKSYTEAALELAQELGDYEQLESANKDLAKLYDEIGNYEQAYAYLVEAEKFGEEASRKQNLAQLNKLQFHYESSRQEAEIKLLQERNKVSTANQRLQFLGFAALFVFLLASFYYQNRKRQAQLRVRDYERRALEAELEAKAAQEKNLEQEVQLKTASLSKYSLAIAQKNKVLLDLSNTLRHLAGRKSIDFNAKIKSLVQDIDQILAQENEWEEFLSLFQDLHPAFVANLAQRADEKLSSAELRLAVLLRLNLSSKEIASILRITPDSVRVARHRLRKKLAIDSKADLVTYLVELA